MTCSREIVSSNLCQSIYRLASSGLFVILLRVFSANTGSRYSVHRPLHVTQNESSSRTCRAMFKCASPTNYNRGYNYPLISCLCLIIKWELPRRFLLPAPPRLVRPAVHLEDTLIVAGDFALDRKCKHRCLELHTAGARRRPCSRATQTVACSQCLRNVGCNGRLQNVNLCAQADIIRVSGAMM